jgi:hypothetical protein
MAKGNFDSPTVMSRRAALTAIVLGLMMSASPACKPRATADRPVPAAVDGGADAPGVVSAFEGEIYVTTNAGSTSSPYQVKGDKARSGGGEGYGDIFIVDAGQKKVYSVTPYNLTYYEMPLGAAKSLVPAPTAARTGKRDTVAGYACDEWELHYLAFKTLACISSELSVPGLSGSDGPFRGGTGHAVMDSIGTAGFPLRTQDFDASGAPYIRVEVTRIEKKSEPDALFQVPPGYTLRSELRQRKPNE